MSDYFKNLAIKFAMLWQSRKWYVLLASLVAIAQQFAAGTVDAFQALILAITALSVYSGAAALEDGLSRRENPNPTPVG